MAVPMLRVPQVVPPMAINGMSHMQQFMQGSMVWQGQERSITELAGAWRNADVPGESYEVRGLKVLRTDGRGTREFTLHWDVRVRRWRWGPNGRLLLVWVADDAIAWVPEQASGAQDARSWRWERCSHVVAPVGPAVVPMHPPSYRAHCPWRRSSRNPEESRHVSPSRRSRREWSRERSRRRHSRERGHRHHHHHHHHHHSSSNRRYGGEYGGQGYDRQRHYDWRHEAALTLECGLTQRELSDLLFRDITPEDYELLCRLDSSVETPADAISGAKEAAVAMENLPKVDKEDLQGESCMICLAPFEADDDDGVPRLPCRHYFHLGCITRWLKERPGQPTCPLCCKEVMQKS